MKRILTISTLAIAACLSFNSVARAEDSSATSTHTGTVAPTCSITSDGAKTFTTVTTTINGVAFPTKLTSTGKFKTLCNTASSSIVISQDPATSYSKTADPSVGYFVTGPSDVYGNIPTLPVPVATPTAAITAAHGYSATPSELTVSPYVEAKTNRILEATSYTVVLKATLTP
jgi:hypothetical protein